MKRFLTIFSCAMAISAGALALDIELKPGDMAANMEAARSTFDNTLTLTGNASTADLSMLRRISRNIVKVDMSGLSIEGNEIPDYMLAGSAVESFIFPKNVVKIGRSAFAGSNVQMVSIPSSVKEVGDYAYSDCARLRSFELHSDAKLGVGLFCNCVNFDSFSSDIALTNIPDAMFDGCKSYATPFGEQVRSVGACAYRSTAVDFLNLGNLKNIGEYAFSNMPMLSSVVLPAKDCVIEKGAFFMDYALGELPEWTGVLSQLMYSHSSGDYTGMVYGPVVSEASMANNENVAQLVFASNVEDIRSHAFRNMKSLKVVDTRELKSKVPVVAEDAFSGLENEEGKYDIDLWVSNGAAPQWSANDVWNRFNIINIETSVANQFAPDFALNVSKSGRDLIFSSTYPISIVEVYNVAGVKVAEAAPGVENYKMDGILQGDVLVVKAVANGVAKVVKIQ